MKLGLINSAWAQAGKGTEFGIEQTKRIGFDTVDIFADPLDIDRAESDADQASARTATACRSRASAASPSG